MWGWDRRAPTVPDRLLRAINERDLDALAACFAPAYRCVWPAHPARSFQGSERVRGNWRNRFAAQPVLTATMTADVRRGAEVWAEWEFAGVDRDGVPFRDVGVIVLVLEDDAIIESRFYMEPVEPPDSGEAFSPGS